MEQTKKHLLLSADGDIYLYEVIPEILNDFEVYLSAFFKWKKTNCYDETLFVSYLKNRLGDSSIFCVKKVGCCGGKINTTTGMIEDEIEEQYKDIKWYNF